MVHNYSDGRIRASRRPDTGLNTLFRRDRHEGAVRVTLLNRSTHFQSVRGGCRSRAVSAVERLFIAEQHLVKQQRRAVRTSITASCSLEALNTDRSGNPSGSRKTSASPVLFGDERGGSEFFRKREITAASPRIRPCPPLATEGGAQWAGNQESPAQRNVSKTARLSCRIPFVCELPTQVRRTGAASV